MSRNRFRKYNKFREDYKKSAQRLLNTFLHDNVIFSFYLSIF